MEEEKEEDQIISFKNEKRTKKKFITFVGCRTFTFGAVYILFLSETQAREKTKALSQQHNPYNKQLRVFSPFGMKHLYRKYTSWT